MGLFLSDFVLLWRLANSIDSPAVVTDIPEPATAIQTATLMVQAMVVALQTDIVEDLRTVEAAAMVGALVVIKCLTSELA